VKITTELVNADPPTACDVLILSELEASAIEAGRSYKRMVARAYHDSSFVACIAPVAMLFIPCRGGVSHRPDEYASPEWIAGGVDVLARTLARLSG
jgi:N-carbamoyl-L-amino-acid hydrolase